MKIHVVTEGQEVIENFKKVVSKNNSLDLSGISDNECDTIMANDALDTFTIDEIEKLLTSLAKKLRLTGTMVIGGTDIRLLAKSIINDQMDDLQASRLISSLASATSLDALVRTVGSLGLNVVSTQISGIHYEATVRRGQNE